MSHSPEEIRRDQTNHGRVLSVKDGYTRPHKPAGAHRGRPNKPAVAKGHDAILKAAQDSGAMVIVILSSDGTVINGKLTGRDKFTITVETNLGAEVIYKHAIERFRIATVQ